MNITRQADYAIRVVLDLSLAAPGTLLQAREVAARQEVPLSFLKKIIQALTKQGLVRTVRGNQGGIALMRPPSQITLRHVLEAVDGPVMLNKCLLRSGACGRDAYCRVHHVWQDAQDALLEKLEVTFDQLVT